MMVLPRAALSLNSLSLRRAAEWAIVLLYAGFFVAWLAFSPYRGCLVPYDSYLADPAAIRILDPEVHRRPSPCVARPRRLPPQSRSTSPASPVG